MTNTKRITCAALLVATVAAGLLATGGVASTHPAPTLTYTVRNAGTAYLTKAGLSTSFPGTLQTGDQIFARDTLLQGSKQIGYDNEQCTVTFDNNDLCRVVSVFPGKGHVEATWLWINRNNSPAGPSQFSGIIDGGTNGFANTKGQFVATVLPNGTLSITAKLS
jgi:hypothetical protein